MDSCLRIGYFTDYYSSVQSTVQTVLQTDLVKRISDFVVLIFSKISILFNSFPDQSKELNHKFNALFGFLTVIGLVLIFIFGRNVKGLTLPDTPLAKKQRHPRTED